MTAASENTKTIKKGPPGSVVYWERMEVKKKIKEKNKIGASPTERSCVRQRGTRVVDAALTGCVEETTVYPREATRTPFLTSGPVRRSALAGPNLVLA